MPEAEEGTKNETERRVVSKRTRFIALALLALLILPISFAAYVYASSPETIRDPKLEHYHFRLQILVDGNQENFAADKYQEDYVKGACTVDLPETPFHFHDGKDQLVHAHWDGMTGGMLMKYYGWNYIGGIDGALGYKLDDLGSIRKVPIHGTILPDVPEDSNFYVYIGDEDGYEKKSFADWKSQDLEQFFGKESSFAMQDRKVRANFMDMLFPTAYAHDGENHTPASDGSETEVEALKRVNNLIGNVVIFVQEDKPSDQQIKDRFNDLEPLSNSTCGG